MKRINVLVVDDHGIVREGLVSLLSAVADIYLVGEAVNGREALKKVASLAPEIVIMDISMPQLDGIEAVRQIVKIMPKIGIIMLSMHCTAQFVFRAMEAGARGYILKESLSREIVDAIRAVYVGKRYLSPRAADLVLEGFGTRNERDPLESLSKREREILKLVADGHSSAYIAGVLFLSPKTVDSYRSRLMQKLHLADKAAVIKFAIAHGLTTID